MLVQCCKKMALKLKEVCFFFILYAHLEGENGVPGYKRGRLLYKEGGIGSSGILDLGLFSEKKFHDFRNKAFSRKSGMRCFTLGIAIIPG